MDEKTPLSGKLIYDRELQAMANCDDALSELDQPARGRVLSWLQSKHGAPFWTAGTAEQFNRLGSHEVD